MKKIIIFLLSLLIVTPCFAEWQKKDKVLLGTYITLSAVDAYQTSQWNRKEIKELNPLFVDSEDKVDMRKVIGLKLLDIGLLYLASDYFEDYRSTILWTFVVGQGAVVGWNMQF